MAAPRVPIGGLAVGEIDLAPETARYVARVLRLGPADRLVGFDPEQAIEAEGEVVEVSKAACRVRFDRPRPASALAKRAVALLQCVGKGDKLDQVVRDATELGATAIWPLLAERTVAERASDAALARLRRVALEAARQCGRGDLPEVAATRPFAQALADCRADVKLILHPAAHESAGTALRAIEPQASVAVAIGPEGGFSEDELAAATTAGFRAVHFGWTILRTETAATAILGAIVVLASHDG